MACTEKPQTALQLTDETVAFVKQNDEREWYPYCTGVWLDKDRILTAAHCVTDEDRELILVVIKSETAGIMETPQPPHIGRVIKVDESVDLAMVQVPDPPRHVSVRVAVSSPPIGADLFFMAHPRLLYYSFGKGIVSSYYGSISAGITKNKGPFMGVVSMVVDSGASGSGIFDEQGGLVGVLSMKTNSPGVGLAVPTYTVRQFLGFNKKRVDVGKHL